MLNTETFRASLRAEPWYEPGLHVLCACSGGPDSTALVQLLSEQTNMELAVVHFNHQLRGVASDADAEFVRSLAQRYDLPFFLSSQDVRQFAHAEHLSLEQAGSILRRQSFNRIAQAEGFSCIATGQHLDDQVETVLLNLYQGSGIEGLAGISARQRLYVRPLLGFSRLDILQFLRSRGLTFRTDESNSDLRYMRNRIRHQVLPVLRSQDPAGIQMLVAELAARSGKLLEAVQKSVEDIDIIENKEASPAKISLGLTGLADYFSPIKKMIFDSAFQSISQADQGLSSAHYAALTSLLGDQALGRTLQLPRGITATRDRGAITFVNRDAMIWSAGVPHTDQALDHGFFTLVADHETVAAQLKNPLYFWPVGYLHEYSLRPVQPGDFLQLKPRSRTRSVQRLLQEAHVAPHIKPFFPVLLYREEIVWIPGVRTASTALIKISNRKHTEMRHCLKAQFEEGIFE